MKKIIFLLVTILFFTSSFSQEAAYNDFLNASASYAQQNYAESVALFSKVIENDPKHFGGYYMRGLSKYKMDDFRGAILDFNKVLEINPKHAEAYYFRAYCKVIISKPDFQSAILDCNKAIEINPKYAEAYFVRGLCKIQIIQIESGCLDLSKAGELGVVEAYESIRESCN